ncbi:MAG: hypothetical protein Q9168_004326 [Polycauliona sp. 1 TL-2023]
MVDQDQDSVASTDLAFIWSTVTNVVPSAMALLIHTKGDRSVFEEVQREIASSIESVSQPRFTLKKLEQQTLLQSLYAETLRFGVQIHIPRHVPHQPLKIGDRFIPSNNLLIFNTWLAHTDKAIWNTKNGAHPLDKFWARRFILDSKDASSGPCKKQQKVDGDPASQAEDATKAIYSTSGLEGAWIPYGGEKTGGCWLLCWSFLHVTQDTKEPFAIPHLVPFFGHTFGMLKHGLNYFGILSKRYGTPIYALRLPGRRIYVISSSKLAAAVDRHSKTLSLVSFAPLDFVKRITTPSQEGLETVKKSFMSDKGAPSLHSDTIRAMSVALAPGTGLDHTTSEMLDATTEFLDSVDGPVRWKDLDLFAWTKSLLTQVSTSALYGAKSNPMQDPAVEASLWAVKKDFARLGLGVLPTLISP